MDLAGFLRTYLAVAKLPFLSIAVLAVNQHGGS